MSALLDIPDCDVIIVNWNAGDHLRNCLKALNHVTQNHFALRTICLVDNASGDESLAFAESARQHLSVTTIRNARNRGFAAACNQGAQRSRADYLLFLNPDTRVAPDALDNAVAFLEQNATVAVCGAQLWDESETVSRTCARRPLPRYFAAKMLGLDKIAPERFPTHLMERWDHRTTQRVDHVMGAFYLIRRTDFEKFGGFDERFFVYLEDLDLSVRLRAAGREIVYLTTARAFHKGGGSSETVKAARLFYSLHSRILYGYKHFSFASATGLLLGTLFIEPPVRIIAALLQGSGTDAWNTVCGTMRLWGSLPTLIRHAAP